MTEEPSSEDRPPDAGWRVADDPRLQPPPLRANVIARPRLLHRFSDLGDARIVAVVAPAGYGKTTLLAQWGAAERRPVAWVSLDANSSDPIVLLDLVARSVDAALGGSLGLEPIAESRSAILSTVVPRLAGAVSRMDRPIVLLIDDIQTIEATAALDALATLVGYLPPSTVVGFAGRTTAGLPMARWRASGLTVELHERDLALDPNESAELVRRVDPSLGDDDARQLYARTEGWPAALYLATRSRPPAAQSAPLEPGGSAIDRRSTFDVVEEYLRAELFDRSDDATRSFLLETAILDRLTGGLCDAVTGRSDSVDLLARLSSGLHLVTPLDLEGRWYRVHGLLRGYLLSRTERDGTDVALLHRRAAAWLAAAGNVDEAIDHLLAAGDTMAAADLATEAALPVVRDGRMATLDRWMTHFGTDDLTSHPVLAATAAVAAILRGDVAGAHDLAAILDQALPRDGPEARRPSAGPATVVRALLAADGLEVAAATARAAVDTAPPRTTWHPIVLSTAAGLATILGDADAEQLLSRATEVAAEQGATRARLTALAFRSLHAGRLDAWLRADAFARDALALTGAAGPGETTSGLAFAAAARSAAHRGDLAATRRHLAGVHGASGAFTVVAPWLSVTALIEGARAYLALSDPSGARTLLRQAEAITTDRPDLGLLVDQVRSLQARIRSLPPGIAGASTLTPAEIRVLQLLPTYLSVPEIADRLIVSSNTVRTQVQSIYGKLGASSRAEAIDRAIEAGLLEPLPILAAT